MAGGTDLLRYASSGDRLSASQWNLIVGQVKRNVSDSGFYSDGNGTIARRPPPPFQNWMFTLLEDLAADSYVPVLARRRLWNPTANSGYGGYEDSTDDGDIFYVCDHRLVGYCGPAGSHGAAELFNPGAAGLIYSYNGKRLGTIVDLECPPGSEPDCSAYGGT